MKNAGKGKGVERVGGGVGTGKGTGKAMRTRLSKLPFDNLPFSSSRILAFRFFFCPRFFLGAVVPFFVPSFRL